MPPQIPTQVTTSPHKSHSAPQSENFYFPERCPKRGARGGERCGYSRPRSPAAPFRSELQGCLKFSKIHWHWTYIFALNSWGAGDCVPPEWSPGNGDAGRGSKGPPNLREERSVYGKDLYPSPDTVASVRATTAGALNLSRDPFSPGGGFRGILGAPSTLPTRSSMSLLDFLSSTSGLPEIPLPRGS